MILRSYQRRTLDDLYAWFSRHPDGNPIVSACVGAGKSVMIATLCREAIEQWPDTRIVMTVASRELCQQNLGKLFAVWPEAPASLYSASLGARQIGGAVLYSTIGSIYKRAHQLGAVSLLMVDECHLIGTSEAGMYRQLIAELSRYNPHLRVIGWTGTAFRGDGVWLTDQEEPIFHGVASRVGMRELLDDGYLAPLVSVSTRTRIATDDVEMRAGDYVVRDLAAASDKAALVAAACDELVALAADRRRWLVYGVTIEHARHITEALIERGVSAGMVSADTSMGDRDRIIGDFRSGRLRALVNVAVLTTGFDVPEVDCIALLRATRSPVLYTQIAGRGMRTATGKADCAWIDFTSTTATLGPVDAITGRARPPRKGGGAPFRVCPECGSHNATGATECIDCGHAFPPPERVKHATYASDAPALSVAAELKITDYPVTDVRYVRHTKPGSPDSLRVDYYSGIRKVVSEWVHIEREGWAGARAAQWWARRTAHPVPETVGAALVASTLLARPAAVRVDESGRWPELVGIEWNESNRVTDQARGSDADARGTGSRESVMQHLRPLRVE